MKPFQVFAEVRLSRLQVSHGSNNHGVFGGDIQNPLVVFQPGTAFNLNGADDPESLGDPAIAIGQRGLVQYLVVLVGPGTPCGRRGSNR